MTVTLSELSNIDLPIYPNSLVENGDASYFLARSGAEKHLCIMAPAGSMALGTFAGTASAQGKQTLLVCPLTHANAAALRAEMPWLRPSLLGLRTSAGCGDRMGLATPGHVRAARAVGSPCDEG